jgi:hypothetical protein
MVSSLASTSSSHILVSSSPITFQQLLSSPVLQRPGQLEQITAINANTSPSKTTHGQLELPIANNKRI